MSKKGVKSILGDNYRGYTGRAEYKGNKNVAQRILDGILSTIKDVIRNTVGNIIESISQVISFTNTEPNAAIANTVVEESTATNILEGLVEKFVNIFTKGIAIVFNPSEQVPINDSKEIEAAVMNKENKNTYVAPGAELANKPNNTNIDSDIELIKTIVSVAKFYINHIPTYGGKLKTRIKGGEIDKYENDLAFSHLIGNLEPYANPTNTNTIEYTDDNKIRVTKTFNGTTLKDAKREFNRIRQEEDKPMYFESTMGYYKWKDYINDGNSYTVYNDFDGFEYVKDDCSGSIEAVLNIRANGLFNNHITTADLKSWTNSAAKALYKKGYECYYKDADNVWKKATGITNNQMETDRTAVDVTTEIITKGVDFLKPGDLLLCQGHGEYYVGDGYDIKYINGGNKKSGINTIALNETFKSIGGIKAEGTFSWGNVHDEFPTESSSNHKHYFYYDQVAHVFRHCECGQDPVTGSHDNCDFSNREYTVIWRKK